MRRLALLILSIILAPTGASAAILHGGSNFPCGNRLTTSCQLRSLTRRALTVCEIRLPASLSAPHILGCTTRTANRLPKVAGNWRLYKCPKKQPWS